MSDISIENIDTHKDLVVFDRVNHFYLVGDDIPASYRLGPNVTPKSYDWVGLYKTTWKSIADYITYVWAPTQTKGKSTARNVVIKCSYFQTYVDAESSLQLLYVDSTDSVLGVSRSFRILVHPPALVPAGSFCLLDAPESSFCFVLEDTNIHGFLDGFAVVEEGSPSKDIVEHEDSVAEDEIHSKTIISETLETTIGQWPKVTHNSYYNPIASPVEVYRLVRENALDDSVLASERAVIPYVRIFDINKIKSETRIADLLKNNIPVVNSYCQIEALRDGVFLLDPNTMMQQYQINTERAVIPYVPIFDINKNETNSSKVIKPTTPYLCFGPFSLPLPSPQDSVPLVPMFHFASGCPNLPQCNSIIQQLRRQKEFNCQALQKLQREERTLRLSLNEKCNELESLRSISSTSSSKGCGIFPLRGKVTDRKNVKLNSLKGKIIRLNRDLAALDEKGRQSSSTNERLEKEADAMKHDLEKLKAILTVSQQHLFATDSQLDDLKFTLFSHGITSIVDHQGNATDLSDVTGNLVELKGSSEISSADTSNENQDDDSSIAEESSDWTTKMNRRTERMCSLVTNQEELLSLQATEIETQKNEAAQRLDIIKELEEDLEQEKSTNVFLRSDLEQFRKRLDASERELAESREAHERTLTENKSSQASLDFHYCGVRDAVEKMRAGASRSVRNAVDMVRAAASRTNDNDDQIPNSCLAVVDETATSNDNVQHPKRRGKVQREKKHKGVMTCRLQHAAEKIEKCPICNLKFAPNADRYVIDEHISFHIKYKH